MIAKELQGKEYIAMQHGRATDTLSILHTGDVKKGYTEVSIVINGMKIKAEDQASEICHISMHKLLSVAVILFCSQSHTGSTGGKRDYEVIIPLRDYAVLCGCDISKDGENSKVEKAREQNRLKDVRKKVNRDLDILFSLSLNWKQEKTEKGKGKGKIKIVNYADMHLISNKAIIGGNIVIDFTPDFAKYLKGLPITQYPLALLRVDERNKNAYSIGLQMAEHANMPSNISGKTANLLKVGALLKYTNLPDRDNSSVKKVGWRKRIKAPFEKSLDALTDCGLLQNWEYTHSKEVPLTDEEADFKTFEEWSETLVHFVLMDQPDCLDQTEKESDKHSEEQSEWDIDTSDLGDVAVGDLRDVAVGDWGMLL